MEDGTKKIVMIVIILICLAVAGIVLFTTMGGGGNDEMPDTLTMMCVDSGKTFQMSGKKYREKAEEVALESGRLPMGPVAIPSPECDGELALPAVQDADGNWRLPGR